MEKLKYIIEDSTIAEVLGRQNFINDESAVLELVKNAYDAKALNITLTFENDRLYVVDDGIGMNEYDIKNAWMHVGISQKGYEIFDSKNKKRILAGSKGIGRFALARLGESVSLYSKKEDSKGVSWVTDWNDSKVDFDHSQDVNGTIIEICGLRSKWGSKKVAGLIEFLEKTYNDDSMSIVVKYLQKEKKLDKYFDKPKFGVNCRSFIELKYSKDTKELVTTIKSDEFSNEAKKFTKGLNLKRHEVTMNMFDELNRIEGIDLTEESKKEILKKIGNFSAKLYFDIVPTTKSYEQYLYKYKSLDEVKKSGIILYRNAFSISTYEGVKDWLGLGKRSRKSPAAASHPSGSWRVRENQLNGMVLIDKKENESLNDMSNRQGLEENECYKIFVEIICAGLGEFERYRQDIIRSINRKNVVKEEEKETVSQRVASNPKIVPELSEEEVNQLATEIKTFQKGESRYRKEKEDVEKRYKYDVRILNVLATIGLKASAIAHETENDKEAIEKNSNNIINALKDYDMWDDLTSPEKSSPAFKNVPYLIESNSAKTKKILAFMETMLSEVEKKQFLSSLHNVLNLLNTIRNVWLRDYAWISIKLNVEDDLFYETTEDIVKVIFDNLILNSIQQNESAQKLNITIDATRRSGLLHFRYKDNGKGLDRKFRKQPRKILEVHESNREKGHGLGMWIVNNSTIMSGGEVLEIKGDDGFEIEFLMGGNL